MVGSDRLLLIYVGAVRKSIGLVSDQGARGSGEDDKLALIVLVPDTYHKTSRGSDGACGSVRFYRHRIVRGDCPYERRS